MIDKTSGLFERLQTMPAGVKLLLVCVLCIGSVLLIVLLLS